MGKIPLQHNDLQCYIITQLPKNYQLVQNFATIHRMKMLYLQKTNIAIQHGPFIND